MADNEYTLEDDIEETLDELEELDDLDDGLGNPDELDSLEMDDLDEELNKIIKEAEAEYIDEKEYTTKEYYGIEEVRKPRPAKKIVPADQEKTRSLRLKRYKEHSLARFSNIYMLAGMLIGVAVFYFLVVPDIKADYREKVREMETSYNQTLSAKNNEIENLRLERDGLATKNAEYEDSQVKMQSTIDNLTSEVENLKRTVENNAAVAATTPTDPNAAQTVQETNAAAQRNNENVIGISGNSIEDIIANE